MNTARLYEILAQTTAQYRKGAVYAGSPNLVSQANAWADGNRDELAGGGVLEIYAMPHESEAAGLRIVDLEFIKVGVKLEQAEALKSDLIAILNDWPNPAELAGGPSYIAVGGTIGDQGAAFQLFALGEALGLWKVITPKTFGFEGAEARSMAEQGWVMITGYRWEPVAA